mmetsp:Transcript_10339/g.13587  ORF Transcript_10339/g.13587 Transcript_10339/m.13587 type:complete len:728 (+) Transcript_10339:281-2464(+)
MEEGQTVTSVDAPKSARSISNGNNTENDGHSQEENSSDREQPSHMEEQGKLNPLASESLSKDLKEESNRSGGVIDNNASDIIELLRGQISVLREKLKQANLEKERSLKTLASAGLSPLLVTCTLAEAKENLRKASEKLFEGDCSHENQAEFDKWDKIVSEHPDHIAHLAAQEAEFDRIQRPKNQAAYQLMQKIVPSDISACSKNDLLSRGIKPELVKRFNERKSLRLIHMDKKLIAKTHIADLRIKFSTQGLDLIEYRAVFYSLPDTFENDGAGSKQEWKDQLKQKMKSMIKQHEKGTLPLSQIRNPTYFDLDKEESVSSNITQTTSLNSEEKALLDEIDRVMKETLLKKKRNIKRPKTRAANATGKKLAVSNLEAMFASRGGKRGARRPSPLMRKGRGESDSVREKGRESRSLASRGRGSRSMRGRGSSSVHEKTARSKNIGSKTGDEEEKDDSGVGMRAERMLDKNVFGNESTKADKTEAEIKPRKTPRPPSNVSMKFIEAVAKKKLDSVKPLSKSPSKLQISAHFTNELESTQQRMKQRIQERGEDILNDSFEPISSNQIRTEKYDDSEWDCIEDIIGRLSKPEEPLEKQLDGLENLMSMVMSMSVQDKHEVSVSSSVVLVHNQDIDVDSKYEAGMGKKLPGSHPKVSDQDMNDRSHMKTGSFLTQLRNLLVDTLPDISTPTNRRSHGTVVDTTFTRVGKDDAVFQPVSPDQVENEWMLIRTKK